MNKARRQKLSKAITMIEELMSMIEEIKDEEQEAYENLPESLQYSERGEQMDEYIYNLEDVFCDLESMQATITEIIEG